MVYTTTSKSGASDAFEFLWKRLLRILPSYWFWTTVLLALWAVGLALRSARITFLYILDSYVLWPTTFNGIIGHPLLDQGWTLSFEMMFYAAFSFSILLGFQRGKSIFLVPLFCLLLLIGKFGWFVPIGLRSLWSTPIIFEFLYGVLAAEVFCRRSKLLAKRSIALPSLLALAGILLFARTAGHASMNDMRPMRFLEWGIPSLLIVMAAILGGSHPVNRTLVYLGNASYSIYLTHFLFNVWVRADSQRHASS